MFTVARVLGAILLSTCFVKSWRNTHRTHSVYDWSLYWLTFCLMCKFHLFRRSNHYLFGKWKYIKVQRLLESTWIKCLVPGHFWIAGFCTKYPRAYGALSGPRPPAVIFSTCASCQRASLSVSVAPPPPPHIPK